MLKRIIGAAVVASALTIIPISAAAADGSCHTNALVDPAYVACQQAEFNAAVAAESAREAGLPNSVLPANVYATKADAIAALTAARAAGKTPLNVNVATGAFTMEVLSGFIGFPTVWITNIPGMKTEPAVIVSLVSALIALAISFGLNLSTDQVGAILAVVTLAAGLLIRSKVTPAP